MEPMEPLFAYFNCINAAAHIQTALELRTDLPATDLAAHEASRTEIDELMAADRSHMIRLLDAAREAVPRLPAEADAAFERAKLIMTSRGQEGVPQSAKRRPMLAEHAAYWSSLDAYRLRLMTPRGVVPRAAPGDGGSGLR